MCFRKQIMYFGKDFVYFRNYLDQFLWKIFCIRGNTLWIISGNILFISKNNLCVIKERFFVFHKTFDVIQETFCA